MNIEFEIEQLINSVNYNTFNSLVKCINKITEILEKELKEFDLIYDFINNNKEVTEILEKIVQKETESSIDLNAVGLNEHSLALIDIYKDNNESKKEQEDFDILEYEISDNGYDPVKIYLNEMAKYPILDKEEQRKLVVEYYNTRNKKIKDKLVLHNLRLVLRVAKSYSGRGLSLLDLIQEGNLGLMDAIEKFDPEKTYSLSTYAFWEIRGKIGRAVLNNGKTIRIPVHLQEDINELKTKASELAIKLGDEPTVKQLSNYTGMSIEKIEKLRNLSSGTISLDDKIGSGKKEDEREYAEVIADEDSQSPEEYAIHQMDIERVHELLKFLTEREEKVLRLRFGIDDGKPKSLEQVAQVFKCTRERIRQIEAKAIRKLSNMEKYSIKPKNDKNDQTTRSIINYLSLYKIEEDELIKSLEKIDKESLEILNRYYFNDLIHPKKVDKNISEDIIIKIIEERIKPVILEERIKNPKKAGKREIRQIDSSNKEAPLNLMGFYRSHRYKKHQILSAIENLTEEEIVLLKNIYGENYIRSTTKKILEENKKILEEIVLKKIPSLMKSQNCNIYEYLKNIENSKNKIRLALISLTKEEKEILYKYFGENYEKTNVLIDNENDKSRIYNEIFPKIQKKAISINNYEIVEILKDSIYELFEEYGYTNEELDSFEILPQNKGFVNKYYKKSKKERQNLNLYYMKRVIESIFKIQMMILENNQNKKSLKKEQTMKRGRKPKTENIYSYYKSLGYSEEIVTRLLDSLTEKQKELLCLYYGPDFRNPVINNNISEDDKKVVKTLIFVTLRRKLEKYKDEKAFTQTRKRVSIKNIYEYYKEYGYKEEEIDIVLETLTEHQKELLHLYYGEDFKNPSINEKLTNKDLAPIRNILSRGLKKLEKLGSTGTLEKNRKEKTIERKRRVTKNNIYEFFKYHGYTEEEIEKVLENITEKQRKSLHLYYGEDLKNPIINENISEKELVRVRNLLSTTLLKQLEKLRTTGTLERKKVRNVLNMYEYFKHHGYTEEEIEMVLDNLTETQRKALHLYYGEDLKNPQINKNIRKEELTYVKNLQSITLLKKLKELRTTGNISQKREKKVRKENEQKTIKKELTIDNIYEYFKEYGYTEKEVDYVIKSLTGKRFERLYEYYGKDFHNPTIKKDISSKELQYIKKVVTTVMKEQLEQQRKINTEEQKRIDEAIIRRNNSNIKKIYLAFCLNDEPITEKEILEVDTKVLNYLIENNYIVLKDGVYDIPKEKVDILLSIYNGMVKEKHFDIAEKILNKCYQMVPTSIKINNCIIGNNIKKKNYEKSFNYLKAIIDSNIDVEDKNNYNLILLLLSKVYELPKEYKERVETLNINEIKSLKEESNNDARILMYHNDIVGALNLLKDRNNINSIFEFLLKESSANIKEEKPLEENIPDFHSIAISLSNNDLEKGLKKIKSYLKENNRESYYDLVLNLVRISILEQDKNYTDPLVLLASLNKPNLSLLLANTVKTFYKSVMDNDLELSEVCLNTILNIDLLDEKCLIKGNIEEIYKRKNNLRYDLTNNRLSKLDEALKSISGNSTFDEDIKEEITIIENKTPEEIVSIMNSLKNKPNIKTLTIGDKDKKLVIRKFNTSSENEEELYNSAQKDYYNKDYKSALDKFLLLTDEKYINDTNIYYQIGVCYLALSQDNKEKAKTYIYISKELSKYTYYDFLKNISTDQLVDLISKKVNPNTDSKPEIEVDYKLLLECILKKEPIDNVIDDLNVTGEQRQIIKLKLCKELYKYEYYSAGDKIIKEISSEENSEKVLHMIKRIKERKKIYKYNN